MALYKIVRHYMSPNKSNRTIMTNLTKEEAMEYCSDPDTSSRTTTSKAGLACTRRNGPWFDSFTEQ